MRPARDGGGRWSVVASARGVTGRRDDAHLDGRATTDTDPRPGEDDVDRDDAPDAPATTGTGESSTFVGRVAGQDVGDAGETGAECRAAAQQDD